jgi:hypothetical protein
MSDADMETVWSSMKADMEMSELEYANAMGIPNCRAITDAPELRERGSFACINCKYFKFLPSQESDGASF